MNAHITCQWFSPGEDFDPCADIRREVFMNEQKFQNEFDQIDKTAYHLCISLNGVPAATGRLYPSAEKKTFMIGRVAVKKPYRGQGIGTVVIQALEQRCLDLGAEQVFLDAQERARGFYASLGYQGTGEVHMDEYCPHIRMVKKLAVNFQ